MNRVATVLLLALGLGVQVGQDERLPVDRLPLDLGYRVPFGLPLDLVASAKHDALAKLGRKLFFDPILSRDYSVSCATCHIPERGFADNERFSTGVEGRLTARNTPTLFNRAMGTHFMWDGKADSLAVQALLPIENPLEMDLPLAQALERLTADPGYAAGFKLAFQGAPTEERLGVSIAAFVERLLLGDSRVDDFRVGDRDALSPAERGGLWFFESRGGCWRCHSGPNFSDESFHNTGVGVVDGMPAAGRQGITGQAADLGGFKTPTLRALSLTAPYMHDGSLDTLEDVVEFYRQGGHANPGLDSKINPVEMTDTDVQNLVALLRAM